MVICVCREKFGLYYVNYSDPARPRIAKDSSHVMAEIIRTHHLPQQYLQQSYTKFGLYNSQLHQNVQNLDLGLYQESQWQNTEDSSKQQNLDRGEVDPDILPFQNSQETSEEQNKQKDIVAVVGINDH
jgi:hypothetical protein